MVYWFSGEVVYWLSPTTRVITIERREHLHDSETAS